MTNKNTGMPKIGNRRKKTVTIGFNKHPDKDQIIAFMEEGKTTYEISRWIEAKYPSEPQKYLNFGTIAKHRKELFPGTESPRGGYRKKEESIQEDDISTKIMKLRGLTPEPPKPRTRLSDENLLAMLGGVEGFHNFVKMLIRERGKDVELQDYQLEQAHLFLNNDRVCICTGGQTGKDFMIMCMNLYIAIMEPNTTQMIMGATQSQTIELMNRTLTAINSSIDLYESVEKNVLKPDAQILFKNGSRVMYMTAKSLIAGFTNLRAVWINEARDIREDEVTRVTPLLGIGGGKLFVLSRPRFRRGYFWDCYSNPYFKRMIVPTERNKFFNKKVLEADRATLSPDLFKIEYLGQFADAGSSYFSEKAIDDASREDYDYQSMVADPEYEYALGIDWGRLRDTSVYIVIGRHRHDHNYKMFFLQGFSPDQGNASFDAQFDFMRILDDAYHFKWIVPESAGLGIPLSERLETEWKQSRGVDIVVPYINRSLEQKIELYTNGKNLIESGKVQLPRGASRLLNELKMVQFGATAQGKVKLETPITDDFADGTMLCLYAFKKPFIAGVSVIRRLKTRLSLDSPNT
jgi:hypothetical protein